MQTLINKIYLIWRRLLYKTVDFQRFSLLWQVLSSRRRRQLFVLQILSFASALGEVANLGVLFPFLRFLANPVEGIKGLGPVFSPLQQLPHSIQLLTLGLGYMIIVMISTLLRVLTIRYQLRLVGLITVDLGAKVFAELMKRPFSWHVQHNSSKLLSYLMQEVDQVAGSIQAFLLLLINSVIVLLLGTTLIALSPDSMPAMAALLALFYGVVFKFTRATLKVDGEKLSNNYQKSIQAAQEALGGIRDVILDQTQSFFLESYIHSYRNYRLASASINSKAQVPRFLIEAFVVILIVGFSLTSVLSGNSLNQQLPMLGVIVMGAYRLLQPLQQCFASVSNLQAQSASFQKLRPFLQEDNSSIPVNSQLTSLADRLSSTGPLIRFDKLCYRYTNSGPWVLSNLDLSINPGERIGFVGSSGSGKSTTCDLILGLLTPTKGKLLVHGQNPHNNPLLMQAWQKHIAHVPQHIFLADASFASNIAFGVSPQHIDYQRLHSAAQQAQIADLIENSQDGYSTVIGERGVRLSGGQRQRIGLARALYKNAEMLILDEATSALDNRTEHEVMQAVATLSRQITVIIIAHRLSTIRQCDRLFYLDQGAISGIGTYDELISENASFRSLACDFELSNA
jgi:ABC-type multidrug transport system fused ATPase/permease subunit